MHAILQPAPQARKKIAQRVSAGWAEMHPERRRRGTDNARASPIIGTQCVFDRRQISARDGTQKPAHIPDSFPTRSITAPQLPLAQRSGRQAGTNCNQGRKPLEINNRHQYRLRRRPASRLEGRLTRASLVPVLLFPLTLLYIYGKLLSVLTETITEQHKGR
jgi:hypothetical protein